MATASDNFDRANGAIGANWSNSNGDWVIRSNLAAQGTTGSVYYKTLYTATPPDSANYYSESVVVSPSGGIGTGACVRGTNSATVTFYGYVFFGGDAAYLAEIIAGAETLLDTGGAVTAATNYTARLEADGAALTGTRGGAADVSATDGTLTTGGWGMCAFGGTGSGTTQTWNDWTAADLAAAGVVGPLLDGRLINHGILQGRLAR
jgi:hypothetical protein